MGFKVEIRIPSIVKLATISGKKEKLCVAIKLATKGAGN